MPLPPTVELICSFSTVATSPLSPFEWLVLKTLNTFPEGNRPEFAELADKMAFKDPHYLNEAWHNVEKSKLCKRGEGQKAATNTRSLLFETESIDFNYATIIESGTAALSDGFIRRTPARARTGEALYFSLRDGSPIKGWKAHYEPKEISTLHRPDWADKISEKTIEETLKSQCESQDDHIQPDEHIFDPVIHWEECRRVKLD